VPALPHARRLYRPVPPPPPPQVYLKQAIEACGRDARLAALCDPQTVMLIGHSRGAKISVLASVQVQQRVARVPRAPGLAA
jgi:pimeloyl-ACP methyl ester carboxylesterase